MASFTSYTYIQCPCFDDSPPRPADETASDNSIEPEEEEEQTFDPRSPRSNYSLYPLEYLLYCDVCHQIRCPRCVTEELVTIYCPSCLFEVPNSILKSEGNRCTRNCFQCPICIGPLAVQSLEAAPDTSLLSAENANPVGPSGPWVLSCSYCNWSSLEIGIKFDKPQSIFAQLSKIRNNGVAQSEHHSHQSSSDSGDPMSPAVDTEGRDSAKARFSALKSFYQSQIASTNVGSASAGSLGDFGFGSPANLNRLLGMYQGTALTSLKLKSSKPSIVREADAATEGFREAKLDESSAISTIHRNGYDGTVTRAQTAAQEEEGARFPEDLWPIPYTLRAKRAKRCPVCRHILSKPEAKVANTRWRIRLVAGNSIPSISIKPLVLPGASTPTSSPDGLLAPLKPTQFLLTFRNPRFEELKVTLATPAVTPGRFASKVTVLCPQFTIDANTEDYASIDDVLKDGSSTADRRSKLRPAVVSAAAAAPGGDDGGPPQLQLEAGKVWDSGRNWVSIVVEVVPASLLVQPKPALLRQTGGSEGQEEEDLGPVREDEDVLEIPMSVRLEWEGDPSADAMGTSVGAGGRREEKEKRELSYWAVLGVGRIARD